VNDVRNRARIVRVLLGVALAVGLLVAVTACWPFNTLPVARFTASALSGMAPLTVNFDAILSYDPDGTITSWEWSFGDGSSGTGESVSHNYTVAGTFTVVLRVTDNNNAQARTQKIVTVSAPTGGGTGTGTGPTATFTATPLTGASPLTVSFNASASTYVGHSITYYSWDFGDGVTGTGITATHIYAPSSTTTYHVVLRIIASDNSEATATQDITVTTSSPTQPSTAPSASFIATPTTALVPAEFDFNPSASEAAAGRTLTTYVWSYGDGSSHSESSAATVTHTYLTAQASQNFIVTLTVIDDLGRTDSASRTITAKDWQPVAGFVMSKAQTPSYTWVADDIEIENAGTDVQTVSFKSDNPTNWREAPLPKTEGTEPDNFESGDYSTGDKNLSYDPEGQAPASGWGITTYLWSFDGGHTAGGEGSTTIGADPGGGCLPTLDGFDVGFQLGPLEQSHTFNVQLTVVDAQGAQKSLTRQVTLYKGTAP
jgi:PKD repeat protein